MTTLSHSTATMTSTIPRGPPGVVTYRYKQEQIGSQMAYVALAGSHEEAQDIAARSFPSLATVDPRWLFFTITIRYKSTNERKEIGISPDAWFYVTNKLVPYRLIDVHVAPPSSSPHSSASKSYATLYSASPPAKNNAPPYPSTPQGRGNVPPYPDSPPPKYPGSPQKQLHPHLSPTGYGYGFGWHDQTHDQGAPDYHGQRVAPDYYRSSQFDSNEMADRRSAGWSNSSVKIQGGGGGMFSRFIQNGFGIFPITWDDDRHRRERRRNTRRKRTPHMDEHESGSGSGSGRSYVPSLI